MIERTHKLKNKDNKIVSYYQEKFMCKECGDIVIRLVEEPMNDEMCAACKRCQCVVSNS